MIAASGVEGPPVIGLEATGSLHRAWAAELERRWRILRLVDDDYLKSSMTDHKYEVNSKIEPPT